jgi:nucleoside-diphosphate-sugar epimerase
MRILVTGSSGTIGTRLCERLMAGGHDVRGVDWVKNKWQPSVQAVTTIADLRDLKQLENVSGDADVLVHLAAHARVYELVEHPERALENFVTLFNALEFARTRGIKKFMFASSRESYGNIDAETYSEDMVRIENCESPYTASKVGGEALVESYSKCYDMDHIILRFSNVYGMYDDSERVVPLFIRKCRANEPMTVFGKEKCLDFTYIDDNVAGITKAIEQFEKGKNRTYNLAYGKGTTLVDLAETVKQLLGSTSEITLGASRVGEVTRYIADITRARETFGYEPQTSFEEGIKKSVEWYTANT